MIKLLDVKDLSIRLRASSDPIFTLKTQKTLRVFTAETSKRT
jgi:hypothetical protein